MTYDIFQQGPSAYMPIIIFSLLITLVCYGAFPLIFSCTRSKSITKKRYYVLCYGVNMFVMIFFIIINQGLSSGSPYVLWTSIFSWMGIKILRNKELLADSLSSNNRVKDGSKTSREKNLLSLSYIEKKPTISFCRKCGNKVSPDSVFCNKCGSKIGWN